MKHEEVKGILPDITDEQLQQLMDLHGADIERQKQTIATLTAERDAARGQLGEANGKLEGYDPDWKAKAQQARQQADQQVQDQLVAIERNSAAELAAAGLAFSSKSAKKAFIADLKASDLPVKNGEILGFSEFVQAYQAKDPAAFGTVMRYPTVKDSGDPVHTPSGSPQSLFAEWLGKVLG